MAKMYSYAYAGSGLAHQRPMTEAKILKISQQSHIDLTKLEVFELIPRSIKDVVVETVTRKIV